METIGIVLSVGTDRIEQFERGFQEHELPVWHDLMSRGLLVGASLSRLDISSQPAKGATQYLVAPAMAFGGETILTA